MMKKIIYLIIPLVLFSCAIGYKKLTTEKLERKHRKGKVEELKLYELPPEIADTLSLIYLTYFEENKGFKKQQYYLPYFITYDSTVNGEHVKYQDFNSEKFRLPFGYFFRFGKKKFYIPYSEREINQPFIYYEGYLYFNGSFYGEPRNFDTISLGDPERWRVDYEHYYYWKMKL